MTHPETHIAAPAAWCSYLIDGDSSGMDAREIAAADAWLAREQGRNAPGLSGVRVIYLRLTELRTAVRVAAVSVLSA